jgi:hypothetical protein
LGECAGARGRRDSPRDLCMRLRMRPRSRSGRLGTADPATNGAALSTSTNLAPGRNPAERSDPASPRRRRHRRTSNTEDLAATIWQSGHRCAVGRVLNLSEAGMLVAGDDAGVGDVATVELSGPGFRFAGDAEVVHVTSGEIGLYMLGWRGPASRHVQSLITRRIRGDARRVRLCQVPGEFLG